MYFPCDDQSFGIDRRRAVGKVKICLRSWRQSAKTATNTCGSKVIGRRMCDAVDPHAQRSFCKADAHRSQFSNRLNSLIARLERHGRFSACVGEVKYGT
jgi:hypothetical protein